MTYRVLIVDDFEGWRRHLVRALKEHETRWHVVGESGDGLDAVEKARALAPDVILLDISLPRLDGINAARQILARSPHCKILFLSELREPDIVAAALKTAARGYVLKSDVGRDLLTALTAIVSGDRFVSPRLEPDPAGARAQERFARNSGHRHEAWFHSEQAALLERYAQLAGAVLEAGNVFIFVADAAHRETVQRKLLARGLDVERAITEGRYVPIDLAKYCAGFVNDGRLDEGRFRKTVVALLTKAATAAGEGRVTACGDGACELWKRGWTDAAIRVERIWDELAGTHDVDVFCGYLIAAQDHGPGEVIETIGAEHTAVHVR